MFWAIMTNMGSLMADPLQSARRKVARAKEHISALEAETTAFFAARPYTVVTEPDPEEPKHEVYKLKFNQGFPASFANISSDALHNLRDSLDNAAYALAVAGGKSAPQSAAFPFGGSAADFENSVKGRCKDIPDEIRTIFRAYQPYKGGNDFLWALSKLAVTDKHKLLTIALNSILGNVSAVGALHRIPMNPTWDSEKREIEVLTGIAGHPFKGTIEFGLYVAFDEVPVVHGEPILKVLGYFVEIVEHILSRLDI